MKTAVEWFEDEAYKVLAHLPIEREAIKKLIEKAKQMEKEQIMDAYNQGCNDYDELGYKRIEQYYNKTYKNTNDEPTI